MIVFSMPRVTGQWLSCCEKIAWLVHISKYFKYLYWHTSRLVLVPLYAVLCRQKCFHKCQSSRNKANWIGQVFLSYKVPRNQVCWISNPRNIVLLWNSPFYFCHFLLFFPYRTPPRKWRNWGQSFAFQAWDSPRYRFCDDFCKLIYIRK